MTVAYCDASLVRGRTYALAALVGHRTLTALAQVRDTQHAELLAAGLAVRNAPPGVLELNVDCRYTARVLGAVGGADTPNVQLGRDILAAARQRRVDVQVVRIPRALNRAHQAARAHAAWAERTRTGAAGLTPTLRLRATVDGFQARVAGLHVQHAGSYAALRVLLEIAQQLPAGERVRVRGVPSFTAHLWQHPQGAPPDWRDRITRAHLDLTTRHSHFSLENLT